MMKKVVFLLLLICLLAGCTQEKNESSNAKEVLKTENKKSPFGIEPDLSYEVPESRPNVLINQEGYDSKNRKSVIFCGENIADDFEVIDKKTGEVVYNGKISPYQKEKKGSKNVGYAYFTELEQTGSYYIRTDIIGQSYPFEIQEKITYNLFTEVSKECYENWEKKAGSKKVFLEMIPALLAFEFYGEVFKDDLGVDKSNNGIPDILDGMKYCVDACLSKKGGDYELQEESLIAAGILAKFANIYKAYDAGYASECIRAAEKLWKREELALSKYETASYFCAAELYKATGSEKCHNIVKTYALKERELTEKEERIEEFGDITYLSTRRKVDTNLCDNIMKEAMKKAEDIYPKKQNGIQVVRGANAEESLESLLQLCIVDHVVTSHEYRNVIENQLDYLMGCNEAGVNYKEELKETPLFLFMLSTIIENDLRTEE